MVTKVTKVTEFLCRLSKIDEIKIKNQMSFPFTDRDIYLHTLDSTSELIPTLDNVRGPVAVDLDIYFPARGP